MKKTLLLYCFLSIFFFKLISQDFKIVGYLPSYRFALQNEIHFERLTHLNLSFLNPDANGNLVIDGQNIDPLVNRARSLNPSIKVFIAIAGGGLTAEWAAAYKLRMQAPNRSAFIHQLVTYVETHNLDGIDVDLEWNHVDSLYSPFVLELADSLHNKGKLISAAWPATTRYADISDGALAVFDWINLMAYDLTGPWAPNQPGDHSPYSFANQGIVFWKGQGVPANRMTLGVPFYGRNWDSPNTGQAFTYGAMIAEDTAYAYRDTVGQRYYNGIRTIRKKTQLAQRETSGVMIWELGQDVFGAQDHLSLLNNMYDQVNNATSTDPGLPYSAALLFPNPFSDILHLRITATYPPQKVEIYDLYGRIVRKDQFAPGNNTYTWNLASLESGMYLVVLHTDEGRWMQRVVKR